MQEKTSAMSMEYRLRKNEPLADGIIRVGLSLNKQSIDHVEKLADNEPHEAVHELRKRFKELRALIRLVRDELGDEKYKENNHFYRDIGRKLSEIRDAKAFLESIEKLKDQYKGKLYKNAFSKTEAFLHDRLKDLEKNLLLHDTLLNIGDQLKNHVKNIIRWPLELKNFDSIKKSLKRVYKRGYELQDTLTEEPTVEGFHEWRKRSKYLRYQMDLLRYIWPAMMQVQEAGLDELSSLTGDDHDLALLIRLLQQEVPDEEELNLIKAIASEQRTLLQQRFFALGKKLYYEKPDYFANRIEAYWHVEEKSYTDSDNIPQLNSL